MSVFCCGGVNMVSICFCTAAADILFSFADLKRVSSFVRCASVISRSEAFFTDRFSCDTSRPVLL